MKFTSYLLNLSYANRTNEKEFIKKILKQFPKNDLTGVQAYINNNPYNFKFYLRLDFEKNDNFSEWLKTHYPGKELIHNIFLKDILLTLSNKGFSLVTLGLEEEVDLWLTDTANAIFLLPEKNIFDRTFIDPIRYSSTIFLSHSSKDKSLVDKVFLELQKNEILTWYDKYEILPGDSVTDKINEGLLTSKIGLLFLSKNFLYSEKYWTMAELNHFLREKMKTKNKTFIPILIDVSPDELPPLLQDYRFISANSPDFLQEIINVIKKASLEA